MRCPPTSPASSLPLPPPSTSECETPTNQGGMLTYSPTFPVLSPPHPFFFTHPRPHCHRAPITRLTLQPYPFGPDRSHPTPTMSIRAQPLMSHLQHVFSSPIAHLPPNCIKTHILSSPTTRLPSKPYLFDRHCSSPASTGSFRAQSLAPYPNYVLSSMAARLPPPIMSIRVQLLMSHLHCVLSSPITHLPPNRVNLSATAHVPPSTWPFEPGCSSLTQLCPFKPNCLSPSLPCPNEPDHVHLSATVCLPPRTMST